MLRLHELSHVERRGPILDSMVLFRPPWTKMHSIRGLRGLRGFRAAPPRSIRSSIRPRNGLRELTGRAPRDLYTPRPVPEPPKPAGQHGYPEEAALHEPMRKVMRRLPHPVVVVTTLERRTVGGDEDELLPSGQPYYIPRAMTVSSFTTLCMRPRPRITFNISLPSTTYSAIRQQQAFNVHVLSGDGHGARIADLFTRGQHQLEVAAPGTRKYHLGVLEGVTELGVEVVGLDTWAKIDRFEGYYPVMPLLRGPGIMHVIKCSLDQTLNGVLNPNEQDGDQAIILGNVMAIEHVASQNTASEGSEDAVSSESENATSEDGEDIILGDHTQDNAPLALGFAEGAYRRGGEKIDIRSAPAQRVTLAERKREKRQRDDGQFFKPEQKP
ncbi:flavin reductase like domain-containing protein [Whalleya microplaca]|nr:flavin reductase like domain-containing protein [Whalleya microplaca]